MEYYIKSDYVLIPTSIDSSYFVERTENQNVTGSCVLFRGTSRIESMHAIAHQEVVQLSALGAYYDTRDAQGTVNIDSGSVPLIAFQAMSNIGVGTEKTWGYNESLLTVKPSEKYYEEAAQNRITSFKRVDLPDSPLDRLNLLKAILSDHQQIELTIKLPDYFRSIHGPLDQQIINLISSGQGGNGLLTGELHEVSLKGFAPGSIDFQNQWLNWGDENSMGRVVDGFVMFIKEAYVIDGVTGVDARHTVQRENIAMSYVGLFDRAPDHTGLTYWDEHNATRETVCTSLASYTTGNDEQFVRQTYFNVTHREADDGGLAFYMHVTADKGRGGMLADFTETVLHYTGNDALGLQSQAAFKNMINVAMNVSIDQQCNDVQVCQVALVGITSDAQTVDVAVNNVFHLLG